MLSHDAARRHARARRGLRVSRSRCSPRCCSPCSPNPRRRKRGGEGAPRHRREAQARRGGRHLVAVLGASARHRGAMSEARADGRRCSSRRPRTRSTSSAATRACGPPTSSASCAASRRGSTFPQRASGSAAITSGPNAWRSEPAEAAMAKPPISSASSSRRASARSPRLLDGLRGRSGSRSRRSRRRARGAPLRPAEAIWHDAGGEAPVYVIGTEVPTPGGATTTCATLRSRHRRPPCNDRRTSRRFRARRARGRMAARARARRAAGRRIRPPQGHRLPPGQAKALSAFIGRRPAVRFRGAFDGLPVRRRAFARWCATTSRS